MRDRQVFQEKILENGIKVFFYPDPGPGTTEFRIIIPFGTEHNTGNILHGSAHALEHMVCKRSKTYPEKRSFDCFLASEGGSCNACTNFRYTEYWAQSTSDIASALWEGLFDRVFNPIFSEQDWNTEKSIIQNESKKNRFHPGQDETSKLLKTEWLKVPSPELRNIFGFGEDLNMMSIDYFNHLHSETYFRLPVYILVAGQCDIEHIYQSLSKLSTKKNNLEVIPNKASWKNKNYQTVSNQVERFVIGWSGFMNEIDLPFEVVSNFVLNYLTNKSFGILHHWLREEKGWLYSISSGVNAWQNKNVIWALSLPLSDESAVNAVRKGIDEYIIRGLGDEKTLKKEVNRRIKSSVFSFQTLEKILDVAQNSLCIYGRILTENKLQSYWRSLCTDPKYLLSFYEKHMSPQIRGECYIIPAKAP